jgi:hypothetical protein
MYVMEAKEMLPLNLMIFNLKKKNIRALIVHVELNDNNISVQVINFFF